MRKLNKKQVNDLSFKIIGAAIEVHKTLGPGLLEQVYETCLAHELRQLGLQIERQKEIKVEYKGIQLDASLRYDLLVEGCIVVELKAVEAIHPIFEAQTMTYMHLLQCPKGILINFCCTNIFKEGQKTFVNSYFRELPDE
jgi:GxxExxY protein